MTGPSSERTADADVAEEVLIRAIAAHRKVNPSAYQRSPGLTIVEEDAMRAALAPLVAQLRDTQEALAGLIERVEAMDCECVPAHERGDMPDRDEFVCDRCAALASVRARSET